MKATGKLAAVASATLLATAALAAPSVEVVNIQQQYPWTNTVDITYTVQGVKDFPAKTATGEYASNETYFVTFEAKNGNNVLADVAGNTILTNALVEGNGTHVAQWQPALGQQVTDCTATPSVFRGEENAYLIINLETNATGLFDYWYEPMSTQEASNKRYNTPEYKTSKIVFRRVGPGTYRIGHKSRSDNPPRDVEVPEGTSYYMAVFSVTKAQYARLLGTNPAEASTVPQANVSYNSIRANASPAAVVTFDKDSTTSFCAKLGGMSGLPVDLPTADMWEVACRAGATTLYYWGDAFDGAYCWYSGNCKSPQPSGTREPNAWGLYDMSGNIALWMRDYYNKNPVKNTDIYTPVASGSTTVVQLCGAYANTVSMRIQEASHRQGAHGVNFAHEHHGFRVAVYPPSRYYPEGGQE